MQNVFKLNQNYSVAVGNPGRVIKELNKSKFK